MSMYFDLGDGGGGSVDQRNSGHPHPMFDYLTQFIPKQLKDLFRLVEVLSIRSAHIYATVKKFGEYPITELQYDTTSEKEKKNRKTLYEDQLHLRGFATEVSFDKFVYGNVFASLYKPFKRLLPCSSCKARTNIRFVDYNLNLDKLTFSFACPHCKHKSTVKPIDQKVLNPQLMQLRRWDPKNMDIDFNPVSKATTYYYNIPRDWVSDVRNGSRVMIDTMPIEFLEAMQQRRVFAFSPDSIYHMRMPGPSGFEQQWGLPPATAAIRLFFFTEILRRANEAIAMEHITPFRVIFPQAPGGAGDPSSLINMAQWKEQVQENYRRFRQNPLQVMLSPAPIGYQSIGGDGRAMLTVPEIQEADKALVMCMGVPMEFLTGGLGNLKGEATLRQLENQLQTHTDDLNGFAQWTENQTSKFLNRKPVGIKFTPFKMLDDEEKHQYVLARNQQQKVSDTTADKLFGIDTQQERRQMKEDAIADERMRQEIARDVKKLQDSLSAKAQQQSADSQGTGLSYDQAAVLAAADQKVQELMQLDPGSCQSQMDALQGEDAVMYAVVKDRMEQAKQNQNQEMRAQAASGAPVQ